MISDFVASEFSASELILRIHGAVSSLMETLRSWKAITWEKGESESQARRLAGIKRED
jgi:hypothetical protein